MLNQNQEDSYTPPETSTTVVSLPKAKKPNAQITTGSPAGYIDLKAASVETYYGEACKANPHMRSQHSCMYLWDNDYWAVQDKDDAVRAALEWLMQNARGRVSVATARSCAETAAYLVRRLPAKPTRTVVPVRGAWLTIDNGQIIAEQPDPGVGVCHRINTGASIPLGPYIPQDVPPGSLFGNYLKTALPDPDVRECVQEYIGYTLTPSTAMQVAQFWVGGGSNGKSVLLNVVSALHAKVASMSIDKLAGFELAAIVGASLVAVDEAADRRVNQQTLKSLVSGGAVGINPKYDSVFTYAPTAKWVICGNHLPKISDYSQGWWRRFQVVEWNSQFKGNAIIPDLDKKIVANELHIVLDWALQGLQRVAQRNYRAGVLPAAMVAAHAKATVHSNDVLGWVQNCGVVVTPGRYVNKDSVWEHYCQHVRSGGKIPLCKDEFYKKLKVVLPSMDTERRVTVGSGANKVRQWQADVMWGHFRDDEPAEADDPDFDPFADMFNVPLDKGEISA